jgi:hypothetical protein
MPTSSQLRPSRPESYRVLAAEVADIVARLIRWRAARPELSADWGAAFEAFTADLRLAGAAHAA